MSAAKPPSAGITGRMCAKAEGRGGEGMDTRWADGSRTGARRAGVKGKNSVITGPTPIGLARARASGGLVGWYAPLVLPSRVRSG